MKPGANRIDRGLITAATALSVAFLFRVVGQAVQRWAPLPFLPPFDAWQGSGLPYGILLATQIIILGALGYVLTGMAQGRRMLGRRASRIVIGVGALYFAVMAVRLLIGITLAPDSHWFTAWISTALHLALATIIIIWGWHQLRRVNGRTSQP